MERAEVAGAVSRPFTPQVGCLESLLKLKKAFTRRSFIVATDNVPVISSRPCMVSAADKSAMQQRHSDVPFTEIWAATGTMILPSYMFAEDKLFCGRIVRVLHLTVKIAKRMAWTGFF